MSSTRRILGIDPGSLVLGWGLLSAQGSKLRREDGGVIRPPRDEPLPERLRHQHDRLADLLRRLRPDEVAIEAGFGARHARAALILGQARGAVVLTVALAGLPLTEYAPAFVKKCVTGSGAADKEQVRKMVALLLDENIDGAADQSDALAVAICHHHAARLGQFQTPALSKFARAGSKTSGTTLAAWRARARPSSAPKARKEPA